MGAPKGPYSGHGLGVEFFEDGGLPLAAELLPHGCILEQFAQVLVFLRATALHLLGKLHGSLDLRLIDIANRCHAAVRLFAVDGNVFAPASALESLFQGMKETL